MHPHPHLWAPPTALTKASPSYHPNPTQLTRQRRLPVAYTAPHPRLTPRPNHRAFCLGRPHPNKTSPNPAAAPQTGADMRPPGACPGLSKPCVTALDTGTQGPQNPVLAWVGLAAWPKVGQDWTGHPPPLLRFTP